MSINLKPFKTMVFKNEKDNRVWYSISDGSKNQDNTYTNMNWNVKFKQGNEPQHKSKIEITDSFFTYYQKDKESRVFPSIFVMKWDYVDTTSRNDNFQRDVNDSFGATCKDCGRVLHAIERDNGICDDCYDKRDDSETLPF